MDNVKVKIDKIIAKKKKDDPVGFQRAEKQEILSTYLATELTEAGISKKSFEKIMLDPAEQTQHLSSLSEDFEGYVTIISDGLDDNLFEPYYQSNLSANHMGISDAVQKLRLGVKINNRLKFIKVIAAVTSALSFAFAVRKFTNGHGMAAGVYLVIAADLFRVSYNCYIKKYCSCAINMLGGDVRKVGATIFNMAKSAAGLAEPEEDPLLRLKHDVLYELLPEDTISKFLYLKMKEFVKTK